MKKAFFILPLSSLLIACTENAKGEMVISNFGWGLIFILVLTVILIGIKSSKDSKKAKEYMSVNNIDPLSVILLGKYVGGHPELNKIIESCSAYKRDTSLIICENEPGGLPRGKCNIPIDSIKNVQIEDASTMDKSVTLGRALLVGVFALAWKKNKKVEVGFLLIDWNDGKFDHSTTFVFEGVKAMENANTARNKLIKILR